MKVIKTCKACRKKYEAPKYPRTSYCPKPACQAKKRKYIKKEFNKHGDKLYKCIRCGEWSVNRWYCPVCHPIVSRRLADPMWPYEQPEIEIAELNMIQWID